MLSQIIYILIIIENDRSVVFHPFIDNILNLNLILKVSIKLVSPTVLFATNSGRSDQIHTHGFKTYWTWRVHVVTIPLLL